MPVVADLLGLPGLPNTLFGLRKWLARHDIPVSLQGKRFTFELSDLPSEVRLAFVARDCAAGGLAAGEYDDAAHARLMAAPAGMRARAERRATMARVLVAAKARGLRPSERFALVRAQFGSDRTSTMSLRRLETAVEGVAPINFAPALLDDYRPVTAMAEMSDAAWQAFLKGIFEAGEGWSLRSAWQDVKDAAPAFGWAWPSFVTAWRRWQALTEAERLVARLGRAEAAKRLAMPALRDKTSIGVLEWVSLDGRMLDFWVDFGDGRAVRPIMLALVDVASNHVLGYELSRTENAPATVRLTRRTCETFGIFDRLYTDNGSAFAGHLVAGGAVHRFRNSGARVEGVKPLGICHHLGIALHFALPGNAQAKIAERTFASLSRSIDDRPEFKGAHAADAACGGQGAGRSHDDRRRTGHGQDRNPVALPVAAPAQLRVHRRHGRGRGLASGA